MSSKKQAGEISPACCSLSLTCGSALLFTNRFAKIISRCIKTLQAPESQSALMVFASVSYITKNNPKAAQFCKVLSSSA